MKKRAFVSVDILAAVIIVILFLILLLSVGYFGKTTHQLTEIKQKLNSDLFLVNLLRANDNKIEQTIIKDYLEDDFENTKFAVNDALEKSFGTKLCWEMRVNNERIRERSSGCTKMKDIDIGEIEAQTYLPIIIDDESTSIEVKFNNA